MGRTFTSATTGITGDITIGITPGITSGITIGITPGITSGIIVDIILDILLADIVLAGILLPGMLLADIVGVVSMRSLTIRTIRQGWLRPPFAFVRAGPLILIIIILGKTGVKPSMALVRDFRRFRSDCRAIIGILKSNREKEEDLVATGILPVILHKQAGSLSYRSASASDPIRYNYGYKTFENCSNPIDADRK